jgi:phosphate transport system substrate-binding protein
VVSALTERFKQLHPGVTVNFGPVTGSGTGRTDANNNRVSFGMVSATWSGGNRNQFPNVIPVTICLDGVAMIVHPSNSVNNLTLAQVHSIYRVENRVTNWNEVGGGNLAISAVSRENGSGTRDCFQSVIQDGGRGSLGSNYDSQSGASILNSTGAARDAVVNNPNAIGYVSLASVGAAKALSIDGIAATNANVQNGSYQLQRPFIMGVNRNRELNDAEKEFLRFIFSADGMKIISDMNLVTLSDAQITEQLALVGLTR